MNQLNYVDIAWRGPFDNPEVNRLHAEAFSSGGSDEQSDWVDLTSRFSLGWATARRRRGGLVGFLNVLWDGQLHAWLQDVMVAEEARGRGVGQALVALARDGAAAAGCRFLHVDFDDGFEAFYLRSCGFTPTQAGLLHLER